MEADEVEEGAAAPARVPAALVPALAREEEDRRRIRIKIAALIQIDLLDPL